VFIHSGVLVVGSRQKTEDGGQQTAKCEPTRCSTVPLITHHLSLITP